MAMLGLFLFAGLGLAATDKRGLCFTPNNDYTEDNKVWDKAGNDLTWYYNYEGRPSPSFNSRSQEEFEFVPMMWGLGSGGVNDTTFLDTVSELIHDGTKITHVMGFNEPDGSSDTGGSDIPADDAAMAWVANFEPLAEKGIKLGLPACTGAPSGTVWLKEFLSKCSELVSTDGDKKNCTFDFVPVHWYDNFAGLASHIGERRAGFPNTSIWVTEYAYAHQDLQPTQEFYNQTIDYFEKLDYIGRYSYFGAFRAENSGPGPNVAFLNNAGKLTDIGSWYLGFGATGVKPQSPAPATGVPALLIAAMSGVAAAFLSWF